MKEHIPAALSTSPYVSRPRRWHGFCGFIWHHMANALIRAVSTVKAWKWEQRPPLPGNSWAMPHSPLLRCWSCWWLWFFFSYTECQRRLLPEWEGSDTMEKQRMSLAGTPGIAMCCLFEISAVVPGENQSWQADSNTGCPVVEPPPVPMASGPTDTWEDNETYSAASSGFTSQEVGQF